MTPGELADQADQVTLEGTEGEVMRRWMPLVHSVASTMRFGHVDRADMVSAGFEGLLKAVRTYNGATRFRAYAYYCIRFAMLDELRAFDRLTRYGRQCSNRIALVSRELRQRLGRDAEPEEIAERLGLPVDVLQRQLAELERDWRDDGGDVLCADEYLIAQERRLQLRAAMQQLSARQQQVLELYYEGECTQVEIGLLLGVTESRVCQILGEAERDLRKAMNGELRAKAKPCAFCGTTFESRRPYQRYCGESCRIKCANMRARCGDARARGAEAAE